MRKYVPLAKRSHTYFVRRHDGIKIARAPTAVPDLSSLGYPEPLRLLGTVPDFVVKHRAVLERFAHLKAGRGWFRPEPELLDFIEAATGAAIYPQAPEPPPPVRLHPAVEALHEMARNLSSRRPQLPKRAQRFASNLIEQGFGAETPEDVVRLQPYMAKQAEWFRAAMAEASR